MQATCATWLSPGSRHHPKHDTCLPLWPITAIQLNATTHTSFITRRPLSVHPGWLKKQVAQMLQKQQCIIWCRMCRFLCREDCQCLPSGQCMIMHDVAHTVHMRVSSSNGKVNYVRLQVCKANTSNKTHFKTQSWKHSKKKGKCQQVVTHNQQCFTILGVAGDGLINRSVSQSVSQSVNESNQPTNLPKNHKDILVWTAMSTTDDSFILCYRNGCIIITVSYTHLTLPTIYSV